MASFVYNKAKESFGKGELAWTTDTFKVSLHTSTYTPNQDTHQFYSDLTNEITASGSYSTGGATLASLAVSVDTTNDRAEFDAADVAITGFTNVFRYAVVYKSTGVSATSRLIALIDFGSDVTVTNSTYTLTWNADGVFQLT
jgi:hypothetical protein